MARQASLFAPPPPRDRKPLAPPHATPEDMARRRAVSVYPLEGAAHAGSWAHRPNSTPAEAIDAGVTRAGVEPAALEVRQGVNPDEIELRLKLQRRGLNPHHLLAVIVGLTFDEARKALAKAQGAAR